MIRHRANTKRTYADVHQHNAMFGFLMLLIVLAIGFGNSNYVDFSAINQPAPTQLNELKRNQIERSLERHRVGR